MLKSDVTQCELCLGITHIPTFILVWLEMHWAFTRVDKVYSLTISCVERDTKLYPMTQSISHSQRPILHCMGCIKKSWPLPCAQKQKIQIQKYLDSKTDKIVKMQHKCSNHLLWTMPWVKRVISSNGVGENLYDCQELRWTYLCTMFILWHQCTAQQIKDTMCCDLR